MSVRALFLITLLAGCAGLGTGSQLVVMEGNYMTFEHPFTDAAAEDVRKWAERLCAQRKQAAIKSGQNACSLTKCTTNYQCVDKSESNMFKR